MNIKPHVFLLIAIILPQISESIFSPCLPAIAQTYGVSIHWVEHVFTSYLLGYAFGMLCWGTLSDNIGRQQSLMRGLLIYCVGSICCWASPNMTYLLIARVIQGFGASSAGVIVIALCRDHYEGKDRADMMAKIGMAISAGPMIGPIIGGFINQYVAWSWVFLPMLMYAAWVIWALTVVRFNGPPSGSAVSVDTFLEVLKDRHMWLYALLIGHACGIGFSFFSEAPSFFMLSLGMSPAVYGISFVIIGLSWYLGGKLSQVFLKTHSIPEVIWIGLICSSASVGFFCMLVYTVSNNLALIVLSFLSVFSVMMGLGLVIGNVITLALDRFAHCAGSAASILGFLYYSVIAMVTAGMAHVHDDTIYAMPYYWLKVTAISCLLALILFGRPGQKRAPSVLEGD